MVEEYLTNISYEKYFEQCELSSCSYSYLGRDSTIEAITSLINIYGGLVIITHWIAVILTKLWLYRKHRVNPEIAQQNM